jgi:dephospho-CoA kinase
LRAVAKLAKINFRMKRKTNLLSPLQSLIVEEEAKKKILQNQKKMSWALGQIIRENWSEMNDEERKIFLEINALTEELKKETKKAFQRSKN